MNCLTEALGLALPGNGSVLATHADRKGLFVEAGHLIVDLARRYYEQDDESVLPRIIASFKAFENAMTLDIAMGGSTNTVLHLLGRGLRGRGAVHDGGHRPAVAPGAGALQGRAVGADVHMEDVHRAGGIMAILGELDRAGLLNRGLPTVHSKTLGDALDRWDIVRTKSESVRNFFMAAPGGVPTQVAFSQERRFDELDTDRASRLHPRRRARLFEGWRPCGAVRQHRRRRLHREDRRRRRQHPEVRGPGARLREPGRGGRRHPRRQDQGRATSS